MPTLFDTPDSPPLFDEQVSWLGGADNSVNPALLRPDQAVRLLNIWPWARSGLMRRNGCRSRGVNLSTDSTLPSSGIYAAQDAAQRNTTLLLPYAGGIWSPVPSGDPDGAGTDTCDGRGIVVPTPFPCCVVSGVAWNASGASNAAVPHAFVSQCARATSSASLPYEKLIDVDLRALSASQASLASATYQFAAGASGTTAVNTHNYALRARALTWYQGRLWAFNTPNPTEYGNASLGRSSLVWSRFWNGRTSNNYLGHTSRLQVQLSGSYHCSTNSLPCASPGVPGRPTSTINTTGYRDIVNSADYGISDALQIDPGVADEGVAIIPVRDSANPRLLLAKEKSIWQLDIYWQTDGNYPTNAMSLDFTKSSLRPVTLATGQVSTLGGIWVHTQQGSGDYLFMSYEGVRSLARSATDTQGGAGLPLSWPIQRTIDRVNWPAADRIVAAYHNSIAYWAIPVDSSWDPNLVIAFDTLHNCWFELDLKVRSWMLADIDGTGRKLYFWNRDPAVTGNAHRIVEFDYSAAVDSSASLGADTAPIPFVAETRAFSFDSGGSPGSGLRFRKKWNYLDLVTGAAATHATLTVEYRVDDAPAWSTLKHLYLSPGSSVSLAWHDTASEVHHSMTLRHVTPGYKIQFRFSDSLSRARYHLKSLAAYATALNPKPTL